MKRLISKLRAIPIAFNGIALSLITLASIYRELNYPVIALLCFYGSLIIFVTKALKYLVHHDILVDELNNYQTGGYLPLFAMYLAALTIHIAKYSTTIATSLWFIALAIHVILIISLYYSHIKHKNLHLVLANWCIPPIGIIALGLAAPSNISPLIKHVIFLFGDIMVIPVTVAIVWRQIKIPYNANEQYSLGIHAAPFSLVILALFNDHSLPLSTIQLMPMYYLNLAFNLLAAIGLVLCLRQKFSAALAAYTFPFAVACLANLHYVRIYHTNMLTIYISLAISSIMTFYIIGRVIVKTS